MRQGVHLDTIVRQDTYVLYERVQDHEPEETMMDALFGVFVGILLCLIVDGYKAEKERRRRVENEIDRHF
jgi:hypothetical protein